PGAPGPLLGSLSESDCAEDALSVLESGRPLLVACGESRLNLRTLRSTGRRLVVRLRTRNFVCRPGDFCSSTSSLVAQRRRLPDWGTWCTVPRRRRSTSAARTTCSTTRRRTPGLCCASRGNTWNDSVPETCTPRLPVTWNETVVEEEELEPLLQGRKERDDDDGAGFLSAQFLADVLVPCLAMVFLLLGNAIVVVIILKLKK
ncbi:hypothetical protein MRX96_053978, partial [Rhipicephalus microplus]